MHTLRRASIAAILALLAPLVFAQDTGPLPEGPGANLVYAKCQQCHPISYVTESAGLPDFLWRDTLSLMKQLGMQVTETEEEKLYQYLTTYLGTDPPPEPEAASGEPAAVDGAAVYAGSCAVCHGAEGQGGPGAFPPLAGHAAKLIAADRSYPPLVVLYGLSGKIEIAGAAYNGVMPAWSQLSNEEIAAALNTAAGGWDSNGGSEASAPGPYTPEDIEAARGQGLSAAEVRERRPEIQ